MATDQEIPTPDPQAADLPNPVEGTASSDGGGNDATNEAPPVNYEERYKASSREAQRLAQEMRAREQAWLSEQARYNAELAAMRIQQQRSQQDTPPVHEGSYWTPDEAKAFSNAVIDQDAAKIQHLQGIAMQRATQASASQAEERFFNKLKDASTQATRNQTLASFIQSIPGASDPNSPVNHRIQEKYQELMRDPEFAAIPRQAVDFGNGVVVDPTFLVMAGREVKKEFTRGAPAVRQEAFTEPANRSATTRTGAFNPMIHLDATDRDHCERSGMSQSDYFNYLTPYEKEQSLKQGRRVHRNRTGGLVK